MKSLNNNTETFGRHDFRFWVVRVSSGQVMGVWSYLDWMNQSLLRAHEVVCIDCVWLE